MLCVYMYAHFIFAMQIRRLPTAIAIGDACMFGSVCLGLVQGAMLTVIAARRCMHVWECVLTVIAAR
jgi:hypothetical protein